MCEAAMAQMTNHKLILNEECTSQESQQHILAQYARGVLESAQLHSNRDDDDEDEVVDEDEDELEDEEPYDQNPSQAGAQAGQSINQEVAELKQNMIYLQHQITLLMNALHVPACRCDVCKPRYQNQVELFTKLKEVTSETAVSKQEPKVVETKIAVRTKAENGHPPVAKPAPVEAPPAQPNHTTTAATTSFTGAPNMNECEAWLQQIFSQSGIGALSQANLAGLTSALGLNGSAQKALAGVSAANNYPPPNPGGRKSKYCSPTEKKAVADYANVHGASAAARKFNIPPPVAAYYHRKEYKKTSLPPQIQQPTASIDSPGTTSGDDMESNNGDWTNTGQTSAPTATQNTTTSTAPQVTGGVTEMFKQMEQHQKLNPAHSTGSPGFLRGRGRGRPKLIGDELDAELVDYMVQVKQSDPRGHLTASQALAIARDYILEKAPGLLEEHGGQIKLKLTWAMKLVTRISERQREIELGLPAGTISNMSRSISGSAINLPGGNFMADMMAQNILSQQMTQIMSQAMAGTASATPEILNVRELELPKHEDAEKGEVIGDMDYKQDSRFKQETDDSQYDDDMESQENESAAENDNRSRLNEQMQHFISTNAF